MVFRYSAINTAYQCLKRYELEYVMGLKGDQPLSVELQFGTAMHLALGEYFQGLDITRVFVEQWTKIGGDDRHKELAEILLARWDRLHSKKYIPFKVEERTGITLGEYRIEGTPDFVGDYEGVPSIVDFKTSRSPYDKKKIVVNEQMPLYAEMAKQSWGYEAKQLVYVVFCKTEARIQVLKRDITEVGQKDALDNLKLMMQDLSNRTNYPKNRNSCGYCPYFNVCYKEEEV